MIKLLYSKYFEEKFRGHGEFYFEFMGTEFIKAGEKIFGGSSIMYDSETKKIIGEYFKW